MKIALGNDHAAVELKQEILKYLQEKGHEVIDLGVNSNESCNYPEYGQAVGEAVVSVLKPLQDEVARLEKDKAYIDSIIKENGE